MVVRVRRGIRSLCVTRQRFVERALPITFEIESDIGEASRSKPACDFEGHFLGQRVRQLFAGDLHTRHVIVQTDTKLAESQLAQSRLSSLDKRETLLGDASAVGQAGGQASGSGAVPGRQSRLLREHSNLRLGEAGIEQRREDSMLGGGTMAGAE